MPMSLFVQLWLMWGAQQRCRLWSLRRVQMHSGTSDWFKSTVHLFVFQVNKYAFHECTWRHSRKRDNALQFGSQVPTCSWKLPPPSSGQGRPWFWHEEGAVGMWPSTNAIIYTFRLLLFWRWKQQIPIYQSARHHITEASRRVCEPKAPDTMLGQFCPIHVLSIQCTCLRAISFLISQAAAFQETSPPNLCKLLTSHSAQQQYEGTQHLPFFPWLIKIIYFSLFSGGSLWHRQRYVPKH